MLKELREKFATLMGENEALLKTLENEKRAFTDDERVIFDNRVVEIKQIKADIEKIEEQDKLRSWGNNPVSEDIITDDLEPSPDPKPGEIRVGKDLEATKSYASLGEQLVDVRRAETEPDAMRRLMEVRATGMSEGVPSDGGFLVQTDFGNDLLKKAHDVSVIASTCQKMQISSNSNGIKIPFINETSRADGSRWGGILAYWKDEAAEKTKSKPKIGRVEIELEKLIGLCYVTDELLADASALQFVVEQGFTDEFGFKIQDAIVNGDGAGKPMGIYNANCLVTVAKEAGQAADTILYENVIKMWSRMRARSRPKASWYINQDVEPQLFSMAYTVGTGGAPAYMPANGLSQSPYSTLMGRPVVPIEQCQTVGDKGDIYLADFSQYIIAEKGGMQSASSIHVKFIYDETCFRFVYRMDGQPWWPSALTPYKGTNTQSPFITLAERA